MCDYTTLIKTRHTKKIKIKTRHRNRRIASWIDATGSNAGTVVFGKIFNGVHLKY